VPFGAFVNAHAPEASQLATLQGSFEVHGPVPVHCPAWQVSPAVQPTPSSHALPFALVGFEHAPVVASHVPAVWH
jgi:hypothetical protein